MRALIRNMFFFGPSFFMLVASSVARSQQGASSAVQVPTAIKTEVLGIQDRFVSALEEECPSGKCYAIGCEVSRFLTLDEQQNSSLPGLDSSAPAQVPTLQYKLASVRCEFTYEASLSDEALSVLRQRLNQKVKPVGVSVSLVSRKLDSKEELANSIAPKQLDAYKPQTWHGVLYLAFLPFLPWFVTALLLIIGSLALLWGFRRLGKAAPETAGTTETADGTSLALTKPDPTPLQIINRIKYLNEMINEHPRIGEISLKTELDNENFIGLSMFLRHFGPEYLNPFKDRHEYREPLMKLAQHYKDNAREESSSELWVYLDKLERSLVAAKVQVDQEPLEAEFSFLAVLSVEELVGILKEVSEKEAVAAIAYAPRVLREKFFSQTNPSFTVNFIEQLTEVDKLPDSFVREAARKMRHIYYAKGETLRTAHVDKYPLLEQALNALEPEKRKKMLLDMGKDNPALIKGIAPAVFLDESLAYIDDASLTEAFLTAEPAELAEYLLSFPGGRQVFDRLNKRVQESMQAYLRWGRDADPRRAGVARQAIANYVKQLDAKGTVNLRAINEKLLF